MAESSQQRGGASSAVPHRIQLRYPPVVAPLPIPDRVVIFHPAYNLRFITLPAYDKQSDSDSFGIHYETVLTACTILAFNQPGFFTKSQDRGDEHIQAERDSLLPPGSYFYHLQDPTLDVFYPICRDFQNWDFPHGKMPISWARVPNQASNIVWPSSRTSVSERVKIRDNACLVSGSLENLATAHVIPEAETHWIETNGMYKYLGTGMEPHLSSENLCSLRFDLHLGFDHAQFAMVPKFGQFVTHFLQNSVENVGRHHNNIFDHEGKLSPEALYARFAWALMAIIKNSGIDPVLFGYRDDDRHVKNDEGRRGRGGRNREQGSGGTRSSTRLRKRQKKLDSDENGPDHNSIEIGRHDKTLQQNLQPDSFLHDVLTKMAPGDDTSIAADISEIEDDLEGAARDLPFLVDSTIKPTADHYHNLPWYPGQGVVERRKQAYLDSHPNIRAHSDSVQSYDAACIGGGSD